MTNLLRVLEMLEKADVKALQCEVPLELLQGLNLQDDGTVDLETLLKICHRANRLDALKKSQKTKKDIEPSLSDINPDLMDLIFNPDRAANFSNGLNQTKKI
jgi:hypothetical protein